MSVKVIDFHAEWCGPCDVQEPILEDAEEHWADNDEVVFEEIDIEVDEETAQRHQVRSIPTIIIGVDDDDGLEETNRFVGVTEEDKINEAVENALNQ